MKFKLLIVLLMTVLLSACVDIGNPPPEGPKPPQQPSTTIIKTEQHCTTPEERKQLAQFIVDCGKAANPLSDEEGEDLIAQCDTSGIRALCPDHLHRELYYSGNDGDRQGWVTEEVEQPKS